MHVFSTYLYCAILLLVMGCSNETPEQQLTNDYIQRIENVLGEKIEEPILTSSLPALPPQRLRYREITTIKEGMFDVLDLGRCNLLSLIAARNSSLGAVAPPSQRLSYEIQFHTLLKRCLPSIEKDDSLSQKSKLRIFAIYEIKEQNLPAVFWNALYTGQEIEASLALNLSPLSLNKKNHSNYFRAMRKLFSVTEMTLGKQTPPDSHSLKTLEESYAALYHDPLGTPLLKSLLLLESTLNRAADLINARLMRRPLCFQGMTNPKADILKNVFTEYYARQLQPYLANVHFIGEQWFGIHEQTLKFLPIPSQVAPYVSQVFLRDSNESIWNRYINARNKHTDAWQEILSQCNLMPNNNK